MDYLKRNEDGAFVEVSEDELRHELAGQALKCLSCLFQGHEVVGYDGGTEYTLSFDDDSEGNFWLRANGESLSFTTSFRFVERSGRDSYFLLDRQDNVVKAIQGMDDDFEAIENTLYGLAQGYDK
ncbi:hypothetical protein HCTV-16_gp144 [Haloarcula virus HCTV-16]|nr:hypothetical protein HCTV-16_gp144 [Haloarcula virus HCTV-16]